MGGPGKKRLLPISNRRLGKRPARFICRAGRPSQLCQPGSTLTQRLENAIASDAKSRLISLEAALAQLTEKLPMGRIARPEEVAHAVVFLASSQASYINGANLAIDGALVPLI